MGDIGCEEASKCDRGGPNYLPPAQGEPLNTPQTEIHTLIYKASLMKDRLPFANIEQT
jgi:hypothetical protein